MPALADDGPDMVIQFLTKAFMARSVRSVLPFPAGVGVCGVDVQNGTGLRTPHTFRPAEDEQHGLLGELLEAAARAKAR